MLVAGGGKIARHYRDAGKRVIGDMTNEDLDWLAIHTTRLNAHLLRTIFQDIANPRIVVNYDKKIKNWKEPVAIGAGWKPGWSTDHDAVILARDYRASVIINLSNVDGVYDKDPKKHKNAKLIKKITWEEMEKITGDKWIPGLNIPFDPIATKLAKNLGLTVIVASGHDLKNLENIIEGEPFKGTVIQPFKIDSGFYDHDYYRGKKTGRHLSRTELFINSLYYNFVNFFRALSIKLFINPTNCLDVGCGIGYLVFWLRFFGIDAYGLDFSSTAKRLAPFKIQPYLKIGDVANIPFKDNSFDLVVSFNLFEHLERSKIKQAAKETIRVARKLVFYRIFTPDNLFYLLFGNRDFSNISFFHTKYWIKVFSSFKQVSLTGAPFGVFSLTGSRFLLKKK